MTQKGSHFYENEIESFKTLNKDNLPKKIAIEIGRTRQLAKDEQKIKNSRTMLSKCFLNYLPILTQL